MKQAKQESARQRQRFKEVGRQFRRINAESVRMQHPVIRDCVKAELALLKHAVADALAHPHPPAIPLQEIGKSTTWGLVQEEIWHHEQKLGRDSWLGCLICIRVESRLKQYTAEAKEILHTYAVADRQN